MKTTIDEAISCGVIKLITRWNQIQTDFPSVVFVSVEERLLQFRNALQGLEYVSEEQYSTLRNEYLLALQSHQLPSLFGTSGIRGRSDLLPDIVDFIKKFSDESCITLIQAYIYARVFACELKTKPEFRNRIFLNMDPRASSPFFAAAISEGILDEGVDVFFNGVASTPTAILFDGEPAIMVTASHNVSMFNGIKAFFKSQPLTYDMEAILDAGMRAHNELLVESKRAHVADSRGRLYDSSQYTYNVYLEHCRSKSVAEGLLKPESPLEAQYGFGKKVILDLAHGVASSVIGDVLLPDKLSVFTRLHLEAGYVIIGYAAERDPLAINEGSGAAFIYGETFHPCSRESILNCSQGNYGYGMVPRINPDGSLDLRPAPRSIYFPKEWRFRDDSLRSAARMIDGCFVFDGIDSHRWDSVRAKVIAELEPLELAPVVSVDCDVDRITNVTPEIAKGYDMPYLSGDAYLAIFCLFMKERLTQIVFTIESSMFLDKFCELLHIPYEIVTVGDRAVSMRLFSLADTLQERGLQTMLLVGAEPSGHVMFLEVNNGERRFYDDPLITNTILTGLLKNSGKSLDDMLKEVYQVYPELICVRKPDAWIVNDPTDRTRWVPDIDIAVKWGLSLREKEALLLRDRNESHLKLTNYAKQFIPFYINEFAECYKNAFYPEADIAHTIYLPGLTTLLESVTRVPPAIGYEYTNLGTIIFYLKNTTPYDLLQVRLRVTNDPCFGPNDITLEFGRFYCLQTESEQQTRFFLTGRASFRNSGTSQKASGYHNLDLISFPMIEKHVGKGTRQGTPVLSSLDYSVIQSIIASEKVLSNQTIEQVLTDVAIKRASFTNEWVMNIIRLGSQLR